MLKNKKYQDWTEQEKITSLREYLEKRIEIFPEFLKGWENKNNIYEKTLLSLSDRIEKNKDDEFLFPLLSKYETDFKQYWHKEIKTYEFEKERMEQQLPQLETLYALLETADTSLLVLFIDLFLSMTLLDWEQSKEELNKEKSEA